MSHHWLLITFSWFGSVSLQYINMGEPSADAILEGQDSTLHFSHPYTNYFDVPQGNEFNVYQPNDFTKTTVDLQRRRRTTDEKMVMRDGTWDPNLIDTDRTTYLKADKMIASPFVAGSVNPEEKATDKNIQVVDVDKKNFSPWGGKRNMPYFDNDVGHMWTWKRASNYREPSMPKRVRFSPWGGKRSGQMIYKPGSKGSKIIFSSTIPELTHVVSSFSPQGKRFNLAGFQFMPSVDKRFPMKVLALSTQMDEKSLRSSLPFKIFIDNLPRMYKPGRPYLDVHLKKDGKRKVKFSAWGGKRSPPIIGPIWTPTPQSVKEDTLNTILLLRNKEDSDDTQATQ